MVSVSRNSSPTRTRTEDRTRVREQNFGSRGSNVRNTQRMLNAKGAGLAEDGVYGNKTKDAVKAFQRQNGLAVDGIVGPQTTQALRAGNIEGTRMGSLRRGANTGVANTANGYLQRALNARGHQLAVDGKFGPKTEAAVKAFQRENGLNPDGVFGPKTLAAMQNTRGGAGPDANGGARAPGRTDAAAAPEARPGAPANKSATFDRTFKAGQRSQMKEGRVTVNGRTYDFRSGGGGRGNLPPGEYKITPHMWSRNDRTMSVGGVGYSFAMSNKYDSRVGGTRTLLRIHPDGGGKGTIGCMGIVGDAATQRQFREDMRAELARNGGSFTMRVGM